MLLRAFIKLHRRRLIAAAFVAMLFVCFAYLWATGLDFGAFWHHFCGCPPDADDTRVLLVSTSFISLVIGMIMGFEPALRAPGYPNATRFVLTRPISKTTLQLYPAVLALAAIALLPMLAWGLLLGWLALVHAPALGHLWALMGLVPQVAALGTHPSAAQVAEALHLGRRYAGAVSVGLAAYAPEAAQRWFTVSRHSWLRKAGAWMTLLMFLPLWLIPSGSRAVSAVMLVPVKGMGLSYLPTNLGIGLHLLWILGWIVAAFIAMRNLEL